jgi:hypothetical protein
MDTTWAPHWTTTDVTKFISQKTKVTRIVDTVEFFSSKMSIPHTSSKDLASIADLELSNALQKPYPAAPFSHIGTAQLQALRQLSEIFSAVLKSGTAHHAPLVAQHSSQFRSTVPLGPIPQEPPACESRLSQQLQTSLHNLPNIDLRGRAPARRHLRGWHL